MTARTELAELIAHPTGVSAGLTMPDVVRDAQDMAVNIRTVTEQEAADMLSTLASLLDEVAAIVRSAK